LAWLAACRKFGWNRVATLNSQESLHASLTDLFLKSAVEEKIEVVAAESFPGSQGYEMTSQLAQFAKKGVTILFVACYDWDARTVVSHVGLLTDLKISSASKLKLQG
jgi:hypothetical protein